MIKTRVFTGGRKETREGRPRAQGGIAGLVITRTPKISRKFLSRMPSAAKYKNNQADVRIQGGERRSASSYGINIPFFFRKGKENQWFLRKGGIFCLPQFLPKHVSFCYSWEIKTEPKGVFPGFPSLWNIECLLISFNHFIVFTKKLLLETFPSNMTRWYIY